MRIAVVGAGPVGGILASALVKANHDITIIEVNKQIADTLRKDGLRVSGPGAHMIGGEIFARAAEVSSDFSDLLSFEVVFICVKATALMSLSQSLAKILKPGTQSGPILAGPILAGPILVSFQNGINSEDILAEIAGPDNTMRAVVNFAGHPVQHGQYSLNWFNPPNYIGALSAAGHAKAENIARFLSKAGLKTQAVDDIKKFAFEKTILNACLSPTCSLTDMTMSEAMAFPETRRLVESILQEGMAVAKKIGWRLEHTFEENLRYLEGGGNHMPSMALDMIAGRPTEIAFFNNQIREHGAQHGVPTPFNDAITILIMAKEKAMKNQAGK